MSLSSGKNEGFGSSELQQNLEYLRQTYFFSTVSIQSLKVIAFVCRREFFRKGDLVFQQNEDDGQAVYIISGQAVLEHENQGVTSAIRQYQAGDFLGGLSLLAGHPRLFSLRALSDMTCLMVPREKFTLAVEQFPDLLPQIIKTVVENIGAWELRALAGGQIECEACKSYLGLSII